MADMGHHLAQGGQPFVPQEFRLQPPPFPEIPEIADDADLPAVFVQEAGRQPDGHQGAVFMTGLGFIIFQNAHAPLGGVVNQPFNFMGGSVRIELVDLDFADDLLRGVTQDFAGAVVENEDVAQHVIDDDPIHGGLDQVALQFVHLPDPGFQPEAVGDIPERPQGPGGPPAAFQVIQGAFIDIDLVLGLPGQEGAGRIPGAQLGGAETHRQIVGAQKGRPQILTGTAA